MPVKVCQAYSVNLCLSSGIEQLTDAIQKAKVRASARHAGCNHLCLAGSSRLWLASRQPRTLDCSHHLLSRPSKPGPRFQSTSYHGKTAPGSGEFVVKLFSLSSLNNDKLTKLFSSTPTWILTEEWDNYPVLSPTATYAPAEPIRDLQYLATLKP